MRGGGRPDPNALPALPPSGGGSLFDTGKPDAGGARPTPPIEPPATTPASDPGAPEAVPPIPRPATTPPGDDREQPPTLSLPDPTTPPASAGNANSAAAESNSAGFQPAKRRGLLSQLFNGQMFRRQQ